MPVGILGILAVTALRGSVLALPGTILYALIALAATIAVHIFFGRRMLLSVTVGTAVYIGLVNLLRAA
jgi:branched-subunit amino acid transport protein AzlD